MYFCFSYQSFFRIFFLFMRRYIVLGLFCCTLLSQACSYKRIPKDRLAEIIVEIFMIEHTIQDQRDFSKISDTTLVYAAILRAHGYSVDDFSNSLAYHLQDPGKFAKTLTKHRDRMVELKNMIQKEIDMANQKVDTTEFLIRLDSIRAVGWPYSAKTDTIVTPLPDSTIFHQTLPVYDFCPFSPYCIWPDFQQTPWDISWDQFTTCQWQMVQF